MSKQRYNWKARQAVDTIVDNSLTKKIEIESPTPGHYDASNELVLPSEKRKTKIKNDNKKVTKILSRKQCKHLVAIVEKKKKKENRAHLLEELKKVQASKEELSQLTSIASIQTKGLKRYFQEEILPDMIKFKKKSEIPDAVFKPNSLSGAKRRKLLEQDPDKVKNDNPNVVGFENSDSDSNESDTESEVESEHKEDSEKECITELDNVDSVQSDEVELIDHEAETTIEIKEDQAKTTLIQTEQELRKPAVYVDVMRKDSIQKARLKLPILAEEQQVMEIINENSVIVVAGETGSGKTTQVPQFLYEAGYSLKKQIGVTEPRRVAAISMSKRVAEEMNLSTREVSYLIRFEGNVTDDTKIKFMTDGVLLKELQSDFLLTKYSVIILDEAHERSVYTDILIGLLSRIVPLRYKKGDPLKLIIMSATLRLEDFTSNSRLFKNPPAVIKVNARQFPVTVHFNKRTNENYLKEAYNKAVKINTKLPDGGILIFVTGQQEVNFLVRKLRRAFPLRHKSKMLEKSAELRNKEEDQNDSDEDDIENDLKKTLKKRKKIKIIPQIDLDDYSLPGDNENNSDTDLSEEEEEYDPKLLAISNAQPLWTLPLYSLLPSYKQQKVFEQPPEGCRLCVVSTNVAETSLTIPNIKYVIDTGKTKVKMYDKVTGVTSYVVDWTSKASADQRAGRAGRLGPGHCYRLYSSAVFNDDFQQFSLPEIQQKPVDDLYLQMKCMNIDRVVNFPFPTAPDLLQLRSAEARLETLGALKNGQVTPLGRAISKFPVLPRYGKMLALSHQQGLLPYTVCLVAALSVPEVLLEVPIHQVSLEERKRIRQKWLATRRKWAGQGNSLFLGDNMVLLKAVGAAEFANSEGKLDQFCIDNGLRKKAVIEIRKLRFQLTNMIKSNIPESDLVVDPKLTPPTDLQAKLLRQILLAGMGDQVAKKISPEEVKEGGDKTKFKYAYHANNMEEPVFLHQSSVLKKTLPEFVVYQEIYETNKMYMRGVTAIEPEWLATYVPTMYNNKLDQLKISTVVPVPKVNNSNEAVNFRPINTLPPLEKVLELAAYNQICTYIEENNLLMDYQSGFRTKHSCETALQLTLSKWKLSIDDNKYVVAVFLDFRRAFETIDISILLSKLEYYGITGRVLQWFRSYLLNRSQCTRINNVLSSQRAIDRGVPQGSVLGPVLFILYLNDINFIRDCEFINLFADDTLIAASDTDIHNAVRKINLTLENVAKFLNINKLKLNTTKTKAMILTTQYKYNLIDINSINIEIYGETIEIVEEFKYLGFIVDNTLNLKKHFQYMCNKISKKMFFFTRISRQLTFQSNLTVYRTIIQPHFDYCASLISLLDGNSISTLQKLQNRGMRLLLKCNKYTPILSMINILNWMTVKDRLQYFSMIFIFKILSGKAPHYFNEFITYNHQIHNYATRGRDDLVVPRTNLVRTMNSLFHRGLLNYNKLPNEIKQINTLQLFKHSLCHYLRAHYDSS